MLCPICTPDDAPRPTGIQTRTYNGVTHYTLECASLSAANEYPVQTETGYASKSGRLACDPCFYLGHPHSYQADESPHIPAVMQQQHSRMQLLEQQRLIAADQDTQMFITKLLESAGAVKGRRMRKHERPTRRERARQKAKARREQKQSDKETADGTTRASAQERTDPRTST